MSDPPQLARRLSMWDGMLLTIGAVVGTGIFMTPGEMAKTLPHASLLVLVWVVSGIVIVAGALTYAELGALFPRAGGIYHFLREAYGPFWGFLYGWTCFLIIMSGGIAAIASGFGQYVVSFVTFPGGERGAAVAAIVLLTAINAVGVQEGAWVQNVLTVIKVTSTGRLHRARVVHASSGAKRLDRHLARTRPRERARGRHDRRAMGLRRLVRYDVRRRGAQGPR